jgi:hypothetical protein
MLHDFSPSKYDHRSVYLKTGQKRFDKKWSVENI